MKKGISPLVATVLLIAITMAVAAVLASYVQSIPAKVLPSASCVGGSISFISSDYPKWENGAIVAVVEARTATLKNFRFAVLMNDDTVNTYNDINGQSLDSGRSGQIKTDVLSISQSNIKAVQIQTNCPDVKTDFTALK